MKTCPVCKTMLFEDMEVCYGCMYRFGSKPHLEDRERRQVPVIEDAPVDATQLPALSFAGEGSFPFDLRYLRVRVEFCDARNPDRAWSVELSSSGGETREADEGRNPASASDDAFEEFCCEIE